MTETDTAFLLRVLSDGRSRTLNEILALSFAERGCGLTVHSRAAELRAKGHRIVNERRPGTRGNSSAYRLETYPTAEEVFGPGETRRIPRQAA